MEKISVVILNWKRPLNIQHHILPHIIDDPAVELIVIAHGNPDTVFGVETELKDGDRVQVGKILHVGNYAENTIYKCWRRWRLIRDLACEGIIKTRTIHSQDDDLIFNAAILRRLYECYEKKQGILISGTDGRCMVRNKYVYDKYVGKCQIVLGRSIFGSVRTICATVEKAELLNISDDILREDDICLSLLSVDDIYEIRNKCHFAIDCIIRKLDEHDALCKQKGHIQNRNRAVIYILNLFINNKDRITAAYKAANTKAAIFYTER